MPAKDGDDDGRQRTRDQIELLWKARDGALAWDSDDPADFTFLYDPDHVLLRSGDDVERLTGFLNGRKDLDGPGRLLPTLRKSVFRYELPLRLDTGQRDLLVTLGEIDDEFGVGFATPDHIVHVSHTGGGHICPATEPAETGMTGPWPELSRDDTAGTGVQVVVVDTGWHPPAALRAATDWLSGVDGIDEDNPPGEPLREYAGHGTFVAGVVRGIARGSGVYVERLHVDRRVFGGGVTESDLVAQLDRAVEHDPPPQLINLSAGCRTRFDLPSLALGAWAEDVLAAMPDLVVVAAAGNDSSLSPFWPASFDWAVGVGSLDRDGDLSSFSNRGSSVDALALGRNLVNAYPDGTYVCRETPDRGDVREFSTGLARWSGTSFSTPVVTGLIAARMSTYGESAPVARDNVLQSGSIWVNPLGRQVRVLRAPYT